MIEKYREIVVKTPNGGITISNLRQFLIECEKSGASDFQVVQFRFDDDILAVSHAYIKFLEK